MMTSTYSYDEYFGRNSTYHCDFTKKKESLFETLLNKFCNKYDLLLCNENSFLIVKTTYLCNKHKPKFEMLFSIMGNMFLTLKQKKEFIMMFTKIQKIINSFSRLVYIIKYKKAKFYNENDLFGDSFETIKEINKITIFENNTKYNFHVKELINIINTSLSNSVNFFAEPISCKNPYTNIPFKKSSLYNIYFKLKSSTFLMPVLFHQFFLCNYDLTKYMDNNESLIREVYIDSYLNKINEKNVLNVTNNMMKECRLKCNIDPEFPPKTLLKIMYPYIKLYYKGKYMLQENKCHENMKNLKVKLKEFIRYNPQFGRKKIKHGYDFLKKKLFIDKITFNSDHIDFEKEKCETFLKSHLTNEYNEMVMNIYTGYHTSFLYEERENQQHNDSSQISHSNFEFNFRFGEPNIITSDENDMIVESSDSEETDTSFIEENNESGSETLSNYTSLSEENNETIIYPS